MLWGCNLLLVSQHPDCAICDPVATVFRKDPSVGNQARIVRVRSRPILPELSRVLCTCRTCSKVWGHLMKIRQTAVLSIAAIAMSACASITKGTSQSVAINTAPVQGANCTLQAASGTWSVVTPGAVTIPRTKHDVNVKCEKAGYQAGVGTLKSGTQLMTAGNLILGGVIGLAVDASTGAMNDYPEQVTVTLTPEQSITPTAAPISVSNPNQKPTS
jgi:hypothetical protein